MALSGTSEHTTVGPSAGERFVPRHCTSADRLMWLTADRVFYAGLLGARGVRTVGALAVYVALDRQLRVQLGRGDWQTTEVAVVQPDDRYEIGSEGRHALNLLIEPETVDLTQRPPLLRACGAVPAPVFAALEPFSDPTRLPVRATPAPRHGKACRA